MIKRLYFIFSFFLINFTNSLYGYQGAFIQTLDNSKCIESIINDSLHHKRKVEIESSLIFISNKKIGLNSFNVGASYNFLNIKTFQPYFGVGFSSLRIVNKGYESMSEFNGGPEDNKNVTIHQYSMDFKMGGRYNIKNDRNQLSLKFGCILQPVLISHKNYEKACYPSFKDSLYCKNLRESYSVFGKKEFDEQPFLNLWLSVDLLFVKNKCGFTLGIAKMVNDYQKKINSNVFKGVNRVSIGLIYSI